MSEYLISIVVPVYNVKEYLKKCVASLKAQTYAQFEVVLVDDGSTDGSGELCDRLAAHDARIHVIHKENGGLISAWKAGAGESRGAYLSFVDSDDWVDTEMLQEMAAHLTGSEREIVASDYVIERDDGSRQFVYQQLTPGTYDRKALEEQVIPELLGREQRYVTISRCMKLISRKLILDNCPYSDESITLGEDTTIMLPALLDCERLVVMDHKAYYHYYYNRESMIHKYSRGLAENVMHLMKIVNRILAEKVTDEALLADLQEKANREAVLLYLLILKNEARGNPEGYFENIRVFCNRPDVKALVRGTQVSVREPANRLLYLVLKSPTALHVRMLRLAMKVYYRRG